MGYILKCNCKQVTTLFNIGWIEILQSFHLMSKYYEVSYFLFATKKDNERKVPDEKLLFMKKIK